MKRIVYALISAGVLSQAWAQTASFPTAVVTDSQLKIARNRVQTTLTSAITSGATTIPVASSTGIVANMLMTVDAEIINIVSVAGNNLTVTRGFDGTTAVAHTGGRLVSNFISSHYHNAMAAEVKAIEQALGPGLSNVTSGSAGYLLSTNYDFSPVAPGGSLTGGIANTTNSIACPPGVNGADYRHQIFVYDGVGAPGTNEAVTITGGSCVAGGNGTLQFTPVNNHSGTWKIRSVMVGVPEAIQAACTAQALYWGNAAVMIPAGVYTSYGTTQFYMCQGVNQNVTVAGVGDGAVTIYRDSSFVSGDVFKMGGVGLSPGAKYILRDMNLPSPQDLNVTSGAQLAVYSNSVVGEIRNVSMSNGYDGIVVYSSSLIVENVTYNQDFQHINNGHTAHYGMDIRKEGAAGGPPSGVRVYHSSFTAGGMSSTPAWPVNTMLAGIHIGASAGIEIADTTLGGQTGLHIQNDGVNAIQDVWAHDIMIDDMGAYGVYMEGTNALNSSILLETLHIRAQGSSGPPVNTRRDGIVGDITGGHIRVIDTEVSGFTTGHGIVFHGTPVATVEGLQIKGAHIVNCLYGMQIPGAGYNDVVLADNVVGIQTAFGGAMSWALDLPSGANKMSVTGNMFYGSYQPFVNAASTFTHFVWENNAGVDSVVPTVASAASILTGTNDSNLYPRAKITGTTPIATIAPVWTGRTWSSTFTDAAPGGFITGGNIAKAVTVSQNETVSLYYDGALWRPIHVTSVTPIAKGGTGTAATLTGLVRGSASAMTAAELSGDATTSGSNAVTLATKHKTETRSVTLLSPVAGDSGKHQLYFPTAITITRLVCATLTPASTVTMNWEERVEATPDTAGVAVLAANVVCDTNSEVSAAFANATIAARVPLALTIASVAGAPTTLRAHIEYTID